MKVKVIKDFFDVVEGVSRAIGDEFEVTKERLDEINGKYDFDLVEQVKIQTRTRKKATEKVENQPEQEQ